MKIRFKRQHLLFTPGKIVDTVSGQIGEGLCRTLIANGIAEEVGGEADRVPPKQFEADGAKDKMIRSPDDPKADSHGEHIHTKPAHSQKPKKK